jgi:phospholipase C
VSGVADAAPSSDAPLGADAASSDSSAPDAAPDAAPDGPANDDDGPFATMRAACAYRAGARPGDTFGGVIARAPIPIDTFVIDVQENRAFDHYFSQLPAYGQPDVDVAAPDATNPDGSGTARRYHVTGYCFADTAHDWNGLHRAWNNGSMDGFVQVNQPNGYRTLGWFDSTDLPFYYGLASTFGISDRYFASLMGPTGPNRLYLYAGTSQGQVANITPPGGLNTIFHVLLNAGITWRVYRALAQASEEEIMLPALHGAHPENFQTMNEYFADAAAGRLPQVAFIHPGPDEHPPQDMQRGEVPVHDAALALMQSPQWSRSAFLLLYDENGGLYDHAPPPAACRPDGVAPQIGPSDVQGGFDRYGMRVPLIIASPWSKPHYVSHVPADHTAILRLLELRFGLPALTDRDANAWALTDFFDFSTPHFAAPPTLPAATVDAAHACN